MADCSKKDAQKSPISATLKLSTVSESGNGPLTGKTIRTSEKGAKKKTALKLVTDRVKSTGVTPYSSPAEGQMFASSSGPDWKTIEAEVSKVFQANEKPN